MKWKAKIITHRGERRIALEFENAAANTAEIRNFPDVAWSRSKNVWHVPAHPENLKFFGFIEEIPSNRAEVEKFRQWMRSRRYSEATVKSYCEGLWQFLNFFPEKRPAEISNDDVIFFNNEFIRKKRHSSSYQNQVVNAIKLYFRTVEDRVIEIEKIHRPKTEKTLPNVLSKPEVKRILSAHANIKHRAMLSLIYSCGLRRSELLGLRATDIDPVRMVIMIRQAKGRKDRMVPLSPKILELLREYYSYFRPKNWLFEGRFPGERYDERTLAMVLKTAAEKAGISKPVTLHWLRHSYATHLLESGTDLRYIQEILGHNSSRTTEIYTHVSTRSIQMVKSPFDDL